MSTQNVRNILELFVTANGDKAASFGEAGKIGLYEENGSIADASSATLKVVQGRTGNKASIISDVIEKSKITKMRKETGVVPTEEVAYIGFNGTSGEIDVINNNLYYARLYLEEFLTSASDGRLVKHGVYESSSSADEYTIAKNLTHSFIKNFSREPERKVRFERVNEGTGTALGTSVDDVVFTYGSKVISATDIDDSTTNAALAVGDLIRVGTSLRDPVYRIESIDSGNNTATLDMEFQGETTTLADTVIERVAAADIESWGIKATGLELDYAWGKNKYDQVHFEITLEDFGSTTITHSGASPGSGYGKVVADIEHFTRAESGEQYRIGEPNLFPVESNVSQESTYTIYNIDFVDDQKVSIGGTPVSPKQVMIAIEQNSSGSAATGSLVTLLDAIQSSL